MQARIKDYVQRNVRVRGQILSMDSESEKNSVFLSKRSQKLISTVFGLLALILLCAGIYILWKSFQ